ncbi:MAG TPA: hypothetical protein VGC91_13300 [Pyrinomonadaceae bacterium]|jgi:predicted RNA-binding Zn-ribbon protein involved in translation (DUF1610 family)
MEAKKLSQTGSPQAAGRTFDSAYGFSFAIALGLVLFIAGLVVSLTMADDSSFGLLFGIPLLLAGLIVPLFMVRDIFTRNEIEDACPNCGTMIRTSDSTLKLECPNCEKIINVREQKYYLEG